MNHLGDTNKMVDTPRMDASAHDDGAIWQTGCDIERELNAANERIPLLIAERDTARRQADQQYKLREEFRELLGTDDVEQGVAVVREMKERIKRLEKAGDAMETRLHLRKNISDQFVYKGDAESVENWNKAKEDKL